MKVLELLDEIEEIIASASGFPLTGRIMVDADEIREIIKDIREELPTEIQEAQFITQNRGSIMNEAKDKYENVIRDAQRQAEVLVDTNDITKKAREKADGIIAEAEETAKFLKIGTYEYVDSVLHDVQSKMNEISDQYFKTMFEELEGTFTGVTETLSANREEIQNMAYAISGEEQANKSKPLNTDIDVTFDESLE